MVYSVPSVPRDNGTGEAEPRVRQVCCKMRIDNASEEGRVR